METKTYVVPQDKLNEQLLYCSKIYDIWKSRGQTPLAYVETYGCQQNEADSEKIRGILCESGYRITDTAEGADVVVMNTCAIR